MRCEHCLFVCSFLAKTKYYILLFYEEDIFNSTLAPSLGTQYLAIITSNNNNHTVA